MRPRSTSVEASIRDEVEREQELEDVVEVPDVEGRRQVRVLVVGREERDIRGDVREVPLPVEGRVGDDRRSPVPVDQVENVAAEELPARLGQDASTLVDRGRTGRRLSTP